MELKDILEVISTGLSGMLFYLVLQLMNELKDMRKDDRALISTLIGIIKPTAPDGKILTLDELEQQSRAARK